jgi:hypothetical protein
MTGRATPKDLDLLISDLSTVCVRLEEFVTDGGGGVTQELGALGPERPRLGRGPPGQAEHRRAGGTRTRSGPPSR